MDESRANDALSIFTPRLFWFSLVVFLLFRLFLNVYVPLLDPSEARYSVISRNMAITGNYLEPTMMFQGRSVAFTGKPPLAFQVAAFICDTLGINPFSVRLPSFLCAVLTLMMVYGTVRYFCNQTVAVFAVLFSLSSIVFYLYSGLCMTDMPLSLTVCASIISYLFFLETKTIKWKKIYSCYFFIFLGLGMLIKGPVALILAGLPVFFYTWIYSRWKDLKYHAWILGTLLFLAITIPWYYEMSTKQPDFLEYFFLRENLFRFLYKDYGDKFGSGRETFCGMAVVWFIVSNLPALCLIVLPLTSRQSFQRFFSKDVFKSPLEMFALLTILTNTLFWSMTSRVMLAYLLPTIPFFSILMAIRLDVSGWFHCKGFLRYLSWNIPLSAIYIPLGFIVAACYGTCYTENMAGPFFQKAVYLTEHDHKEFAPCFYFVEQTPFAADFYLQQRVYHHKDESLEESIKRSESFYLMIKRSQKKQVKISDKRRLIYSNCQWMMYTPEYGDDKMQNNSQPL